MRCLASVNVGGVDRTLLQINDFSIIPTSVKQSTYFARYASVYTSSSTNASWVVDTGYSFYHSTKDDIGTTQAVPVFDNQYFTLNCPSGPYYKPNNEYVNGLTLFNNITHELTVGYWGLTENNYSTSGDGGYRNYYIGIVLDDENQRGYIIVETFTYNTRVTNGWNVSVLGGTVNGLDYVYEVFANISGGAGSGYIGNSLLSNKKMVGFNVPTSSAEGTKTESVNVYSVNPEENKPKAGNGFARIKYLDKPSYVQITSEQAAELKQTLFKIIDAKDQWTTDYRYIGCDIEPILVSQTPYVIESSKSQHSAGSYYNSAFEGDNSYVRMFLMWNQMPTVFEHQKGQPIDSHPFYDPVSGKWILMAYATWDFSSNYTDANLVSSDLPLYKFDSTGYFNYCKTRQNS